eukprot:352130-Chlamydomonas_euryale.AAC.2
MIVTVHMSKVSADARAALAAGGVELADYKAMVPDVAALAASGKRIVIDPSKVWMSVGGVDGQPGEMEPGRQWCLSWRCLDSASSSIRERTVLRTSSLPFLIAVVCMWHACGCAAARHALLLSAMQRCRPPCGARTQEAMMRTRMRPVARPSHEPSDHNQPAKQPIE